MTTEYSLTPEQASSVASLAQAPLPDRIAALQKYANEHGTGAVIELFAHVVGMANSVSENARQMTDLVLISELGMHPDRFDSVNLPTLLGACQGVLLAAQCDPEGACAGCAYRLGTMANQSPIATTDAAYMSFDQRGFMCHAEVGVHGEPTKVCIGHAKAATKPDTK